MARMIPMVTLSILLIYEYFQSHSSSKCFIELIEILSLILKRSFLTQVEVVENYMECSLVIIKLNVSAFVKKSSIQQIGVPFISFLYHPPLFFL